MQLQNQKRDAPFILPDALTMDGSQRCLLRKLGQCLHLPRRNFYRNACIKSLRERERLVNHCGGDANEEGGDHANRVNGFLTTLAILCYSLLREHTQNLSG